ncbi:MAG: N-acetylmuramoyl-L-alanine amidase [Firmicutes bacterium]|nr:N-acetylmuramoyl-L-alanine amidase [Bacillota bacterium]
MPSVLLSACGVEAAEHCNGAKEGAVMGAILGLLQDYMQVSGLKAALRPPEVPPAMVASIANRQRADLLFSLRSNVSPGGARRPLQGCDVCYHPASERSRRLAELLQESIRPVSVDPERVRTMSSPGLPDFRMAKCPAVQLRLGFRDHPDDAQWMLQRPGVISHALAKALAAWFEVPCKSPFSDVQATVNAPGGSLALRRAPLADAELLRPLPNGTRLTLLHREGEWQYVEFDGACGYVSRKFLQIK